MARPTIVAVASGKGGVGKSVVAASLAVLLARQGRRVTLLDLDLGGADAHLLFGVFHPARTLTDFIERRVATLDEVAIPLEAFGGLRLVVGTGETIRTANLLHASKQRLIRNALRLDSDVLVVDIGAGTALAILDFFLLADLPLALATPDGLAAIDLARFLQLVTLRRIAAALTAFPELQRDLATRPFGTLSEVLACVAEHSVEAQDLVRQAIDKFQPNLVLNRTREGSRLARFRLTQLVQAYLGRSVPVLGEIPDDRAVDAAVASFLPVVEADPEGPASRALNGLAFNVGGRIDTIRPPRAMMAAAGPW